MIVVLARTTPADLLWPAGQVEQQRIIAQGEAPRRLAAAMLGQTNRAQTLLALTALALQLPLGLRPELGAVIQVSELVQHRRQQFAAFAAMGPGRLAGDAAAIAEGGQQRGI